MGGQPTLLSRTTPLVPTTHATAEHKLIHATYRGEGRHWDFERYATLHKEQHTFLEGLKEYGYAGMDEGRKTRHLLAGIKTAALDSVLYNAELRQDFAKCVVQFKDYIRQCQRARFSYVFPMFKW